VVRRLAITAALLAALDASAAAPWHLAQWQARCELKIERRADSPAAWVEFYHGGRCAKDGSDIRILDESGALLPHTITTTGPGDRLLITFRIPKSDRAWLYYGNRLPQAAPQPWQPRAGLLMKVYRLGEGRSDTVEDLKALVKTSTELLGSGYRPKVFDGFSPFSDSDNFLAVYDGWIRIDKPDTYSFCTNSDDSSFLYINGTLVASFPGRHGPHAVRGQRNGAIELDRGVHRLTYFHVEYVAGQAAVAGWKPPGAKYYRLLDDHMFVPISRARIVSNETPTGPVLDFTFSYAANYLCDKFGNVPIIGVSFAPTGLGRIGARSVRWRFGDGQTSAQRRPTHAYLSQGPRTVTLEVVDASNRTWRVAHQFPVYAVEGHNARRPEAIGDRLARVLAGYDLAALSLDELVVLVKFWTARHDDANERRVLRRLLNRLPDDDERLGRYGVRYVELLANAVDPDSVTQRKRALDLLLAKKLPRRDELALRLLYGDHLLETEGDYAKAEEHFQWVVSNGKRDKARRTALIRLGDVALEQGDIPLARERYRAVPLARRHARTETVLHNAYGHLVENLVRQRRYDDALATIEKWESALPADKLDGYSFILRVRVATVQADTRTAKRYASLIIEKLEADQHKPEAYYALISLLVEEHKTAQARELYDRLTDEFPTSPYVAKLSGALG